MPSVRHWRETTKVALIFTNTFEWATDTESTKPPEHTQNVGQLGVYLVFKWTKRGVTSRNDTQFGTPRNRMKWAFFNNTKRYE